MPGIFEHLRDRFEALWAFERTTNECDVLTNNAAERALRAGVIKRKISYGTQSWRGARFVARMLTVAQTLRQQGRRVYDFLTDAVDAHRRGEEPPRLVPASA
jgi:transposase